MGALSSFGFVLICGRYHTGWIPLGTPPSGYLPIFGMYPTGWVILLLCIPLFLAGYPIHRLLRQIGIVQIVGDIQPLGLINNPISGARNRREDAAAEADGI